MIAMNISDLIITRCLYDWMYLAEIAMLVREGDPNSKADQVMDSTLTVLGSLLRDDLIEIGDVLLGGSGFTPWKIPKNDILDRIRKYWMALKEPISLGDVCWIRNTSKGSERANLLVSSNEIL
jgi:hypothetical protein